MTQRTDYQRIGDLVLLCAQTMRRISAEKRRQGMDCPFRPAAHDLEELSHEIKTIAENLPAEWDCETGAAMNS